MMLDDLTEIRAHIEAAHTEICEIAEQGVTRRWRMHIPAQPDRDSDLLISRALKDAEELADEVERLRDKVLIQGGIHNGGSVSCDAVNELLQQAEAELERTVAQASDHIGDALRRLEQADAAIERVRQVIALARERDEYLLTRRDGTGRDRLDSRHRRLEWERRAWEVRDLADRLDAALDPTPDGQARTTTDNPGHCQGCADPLAKCRAEGGRCCDLCQHSPTPAPPKGDTP